MSVDPADQTIAERLEQIEMVLKFVPEPWYRQELIREYLNLTDPKPLELDL